MSNDKVYQAGIADGVSDAMSWWLGDKYNNPGLFLEDGVKSAVFDWIEGSAMAQIGLVDGFKNAATEWLNKPENVDALGAAIARHMR